MSRKYYPLAWWQLWRWNPYWHSYTFRYKWVRTIYQWWFGRPRYTQKDWEVLDKAQKTVESLNKIHPKEPQE